MREYRHPYFKEVFFAEDASILPAGCYQTGNSADRYSEENRLHEMASILGYAQCYEHNLHVRGTVSFSAQWFLHDNELVAPALKYWN
ncbi:hypothetical protein [Agrobacterium tumefaciens]|uniref:hypothetical protein n=1 Tax=Agrobacterium tumefaciens TaxID=358 RepID=UPI0021D1A164|nr:hypothetical protein [Agrobacterium tumefaciens]UXS01609.1 hypothetical protein FY156_09075 [Agrobacterium tumefaciens]